MFDRIDALDDRSAAGIIQATEAGEIPPDESYARVIEEARTLSEEGRGEWRYIGSLGDHPQWEPPTGDELAQEPPQEPPQESPL